MDIPGYKIQSELGKGGMATVYMAIQESFGRPVAIKIMAPALMADESFGKRFIREAKICAQLTHPHIVPVYDVGIHEGAHYLAMEYVSGGCLKDRMREGLKPVEVERVIRDIALALDYAGEQDFVHRDVKPDNILFRQDGSAVLMDFGIARPTHTEEQMTMMGTIVGTPKYMSPEQHRGKEIDPRADIYSLGVMFFEMLTGKPPYQADDPMSLGIKHITEPVPLMPGTLKRYQPIIRKMLAKDPDQRFQRGKEVVSALEALAQQKVSTPAATPQAASASTAPANPTGPVKFTDGNESKIVLEPRLRCKELKEKAGLLSSHFVFDIYMVADDFNQFQKQFEQVTEQLHQWGEQRGKKCGRIQFKATIHPWIAGRVKEYIKRLRSADTHSFMQSIPVRLNMLAADGQPIERLVLEPASNEPEQA